LNLLILKKHSLRKLINYYEKQSSQEISSLWLSLSCASYINQMLSASSQQLLWNPGLKTAQLFLSPEGEGNDWPCMTRRSTTLPDLPLASICSIGERAVGDQAGSWGH
jgi:hypothetical protein